MANAVPSFLLMNSAPHWAHARNSQLLLCIQLLCLTQPMCGCARNIFSYDVELHAVCLPGSQEEEAGASVREVDAGGRWCVEVPYTWDAITGTSEMG